MRTLLRSLGATGALISLVSAAAIAQSPPIGAVTIEPGPIELASVGIMSPNADRTAYVEQGRQMTMSFEASDPRLSGEVTCAGDRLVNRDGSFVEAETFAIVNDGGRWVGQSTGHYLAQPASDLVIGNGLLPSRDVHTDVVVLRGKGGYDGLSAVIEADWSANPPAVSGAIFSGELPTAPELSIG